MLGFLSAFCIFFLLPFASMADGRVHFKHISLSDGLSHSNALCVQKDSYGFVWVGTEDGLNMYNGYEFETFRHSLNDLQTLEPGYVNRIMEDSDSNLWVCTNALNLLNRETATFTKYHFNQIDSLYPHSSYAHALLEDDDGSLWVATYTGLYNFNKESLSLKHYRIDTTNGQPVNTIRALKELDSDNLLVGTQSHGLYVFNKPKGKFYPYTINGHLIFEGKEVFTILVDSKDRIWAGTRGHGLAIIDPAQGSVKFHSTETGIPNNQIYAIDEGLDGRVWVGTDAGLCSFTPNLSQIECYYVDDKHINSLSSNSITNLTVDQTGILWVTTRFGGVSMYDPSKYKFNLYRNIPSNPKSLSYNFVTSFAEAPDGSILIGTDGGGVNIFAEGEVYPEPILAKIPELRNGKLQEIKVDAQGNVWIADWGQGVYLYDILSQTVRHFSEREGLTNQYILSLLEDSNGNVWAGSWKDGPYLYNNEEDQFIKFPSVKDSDVPLSTTIVNAIIEDHNGQIWFATQTQGVFIFNPQTNSISRHIHSPNLPLDKGLNNQSVQVIYEDTRNLVWIGTNGGGLSKYNPADSSFTHYTTEHGLPSNVVHGIAEDPSGVLWITSNKGVARARVMGNHKLSVLNTFSVSDGLQGDLFIRGAVLCTSQGYIFLGGKNGFNRQHIDSLKINQTIPPVYLTGFALFNKPIDVHSPENLFSKHITHLKELTLRYNQSVLTFTYAALNYSNTYKNQYAYYLEPFEEEWNYVGARREATYTNLNPGTYTLHVKASNNDGVWNEDGVTLTIIILPPWWQTWWFRVITIALILLIILLVIKLRVRFLENQRKHLQELVQERTKNLNIANNELIFQQQEIVQQNEEIVQQNEEIMVQYEQIQKQKEVVDERNLSLQNLNKELDEYRLNLEGLVEERTRELLEAKHRAEESDRLKTSFLTNMSHEVRTPLNAIVGFADIVCNPEFDESEKMDSVEVIKHNCDYLLQLIEDIIDISKIEVGQVKICMRSISIGEIFEEIGRNMFGGYPIFKKTKDQSIHFKTTLPEELSKTSLSTDIKRLRQVFFNLIGNAFKYTKRGEVEVGCEQINDHEIRFFVRDTGIGIKAENIERIFNRFMKIEDDKALALHRGAGIGLTLVKPLVELLGGRIWVESEYGKGATFSFTHPVGKGAMPSKSDKKADRQTTDLSGLVILLVEDEVSNMFLLESFLKKRNAIVYNAWNGKEAVDMVASHKDINLVLMDLKMPVMNGFEAIGRIRELRPNLTVIAQTAMVMADEIELIEKSGFDDYIIKPISFTFLVSRLAPYKP